MSSMHVPIAVYALHYHSKNKQTHHNKSGPAHMQSMNLATVHLLTSVDGAEETNICVNVVQPEALNANGVQQQVIT